MYVSVYYEFSLHRSLSPYWVNLVKFSVEMEFGLWAESQEPGYHDFPKAVVPSLHFLIDPLSLTCVHHFI